MDAFRSEMSLNLRINEKLNFDLSSAKAQTTSRDLKFTVKILDKRLRPLYVRAEILPYFKAQSYASSSEILKSIIASEK